MNKKKSNSVPLHLLEEIKSALGNVDFGSIEIFIQNKIVTQITVRNIHKTSLEIESQGQNVDISSNTHSESVSNNHIQRNIYMQKSSVKISE